MNKTKRDKNEGKTAFAARVVTQYGDYISAKDAWLQLVDKRGVGVKGWRHFQTNLSDAVRFGLLSKKRGEDSKGNSRILYGPPTSTLYKPNPFDSEEYTFPQTVDVVMEYQDSQRQPSLLTVESMVVDAVQRPNRPSIEDIPLGDILTYNGEERDDIMSVLTDLIYDTSLRELRNRYPTLEDLVWSIVGGDE